jgi:hypothetical protein
MQNPFKDNAIGLLNSDDHFWGFIALGIAFLTYTLPALFKSAVLWYKCRTDFKSLELLVMSEARAKQAGMLKKARKRLGN